MCPFCIGSSLSFGRSLMSRGRIYRARGKIQSIIQTNGGNMGQVTNEQVNFDFSVFEDNASQSCESAGLVRRQLHVKTRRT